MPVKIAFFTYPAAFQNIGGGEIVMLKLRQYLQRTGLRIDLFDTWNARIQDYQVLHVFGSVKDCLGLVRVARARKVKVVITPIFWSDLKWTFFTEGGARVRLGLAMRHSMKWLFPQCPSARRDLLCLSDAILPNSEMEKKQICRLFGIPADKIKVIYNGVDREFAEAQPELFRQRFSLNGEPFVLSVGRIEPRKNQLNLIRALKCAQKKLVLIGDPVSGYEDYYRQCVKEGAAFCNFLPAMKHEDPLLRSSYAACQVFVLPAWFETPGLAALEAALAGASLVVTKGGSTREYFENYVAYLDPSKPFDMRNQIEKQSVSRKNPTLKEHILKRFTWERITEDHKRLYEKVLAK